MWFMMTRWRAIPVAVVLLAITTGLAEAQEVLPPPPAVRQSLDGAWWTGPLLANNATTAPPGHFLIEPYFYDVIGVGHYDGAGVRRSVTRTDSFGSSTFVVYGRRRLAGPVRAHAIPCRRLDAGDRDQRAGDVSDR